MKNTTNKDNNENISNQENKEEKLNFSSYEELAKKIGNLVDKKNVSYGNSFEQAEIFLRLLYPNGINLDQYGDMLCIVRIFDKIKRIATQKNAFNENPYEDIVGYGLLGIVKDIKKQNSNSIISNSFKNEEDVKGEAPNQILNNDLKSLKNENVIEEELVSVDCIICKKHLTNVKKHLSQNTFMHEECFYKTNVYANNNNNK